MRGATRNGISTTGYFSIFQSTRPSRGATCRSHFRPSRSRDFNPRAPRGARQLTLIRLLPLLNFNPRAPRGARLSVKAFCAASHLFQSTRPARGATRVLKSKPAEVVISIHAPREGRDMKDAYLINEDKNFNPRAPRGARRRGGATVARHTLFQSTRPARGATCFGAVVLRVLINFNPRAPRGARLLRP